MPVSGSLFTLFSGCLNPVTSAEQSLGKPELDSVPKEGCMSLLPQSPLVGIGFSTCPMVPLPFQVRGPSLTVFWGSGSEGVRRPFDLCLTRQCQQAGEYVSLNCAAEALFHFGEVSGPCQT